jgi:hypothetical protein
MQIRGELALDALDGRARGQDGPAQHLTHSLELGLAEIMLEERDGPGQ